MSAAIKHRSSAISQRRALLRALQRAVSTAADMSRNRLASKPPLELSAFAPAPRGEAPPSLSEMHNAFVAQHRAALSDVPLRERMRLALSEDATSHVHVVLPPKVRQNRTMARFAKNAGEAVNAADDEIGVEEFDELLRTVAGIDLETAVCGEAEADTVDETMAATDGAPGPLEGDDGAAVDAEAGEEDAANRFSDRDVDHFMELVWDKAASRAKIANAARRDHDEDALHAVLQGALEHRFAETSASSISFLSVHATAEAQPRQPPTETARAAPLPRTKEAPNWFVLEREALCEAFAASGGSSEVRVTTATGSTSQNAPQTRPVRTNLTWAAREHGARDIHGLKALDLSHLFKPVRVVERSLRDRVATARAHSILPPALPRHVDVEAAPRPPAVQLHLERTVSAVAVRAKLWDTRAAVRVKIFPACSPFELRRKSSAFFDGVQ